MMEVSLIDQVLKVADKISAPVMLVFVAYGAWRVVHWLAPRGDSVVKGHLDFLKTMKDLLSSTTNELSAQGATLREMADSQREAHEENRRIAREILEAVNASRNNPV